jgi:hypothetical protein
MFSGTILSDSSGQDALEYTVLGLVAVLAGSAIAAIFIHGAFGAKMSSVSSHWIP